MPLFNLFDQDPQPPGQDPGVFNGAGSNGVPQQQPPAPSPPAMGQSQHGQNVAAMGRYAHYGQGQTLNQRRTHANAARDNAAFQKTANPIGGDAIAGIQEQRLTDAGAPTNFDFVQAQRGIYG